jgi:hypothetical protein
MEGEIEENTNSYFPGVRLTFALRWVWAPSRKTVTLSILLSTFFLFWAFACRNNKQARGMISCLIIDGLETGCG